MGLDLGFRGGGLDLGFRGGGLDLGFRGGGLDLDSARRQTEKDGRTERLPDGERERISATEMALK
jgi:hypothetical protein